MKILCLRTDNGMVVPLCWNKKGYSNREAKKLAKKFMTDKDVVGYAVLDWRRIYDKKSDVLESVPNI